ncbi:MAG: multicopper oxidase family protein [Pseudomonadota bacterium]
MTEAPASLARRQVLAGAAGLAAVAVMPKRVRASSDGPVKRLVAAPGEAPLVVPEGPPTPAWLYNGRVPGPVLRARQGDTLTVEVENRLDEPTTVHWHGLRVPVEMDGVPVLSQPPIAPGGRFTYRLPLKDTGTFWYHPHIRSGAQVGQGLHGVLIVEEPPEIAARLGADREIVWVLDDWRLDSDARIAPFGNRHDATHGGRMGNVLTINGSHHTREMVRAGERVRLRLCNAANARSFYLGFFDLDPWIVALDGHPIAPRRMAGGGLWLGAGQRADLVLDVDLAPGATARVIDGAGGPDQAFEVMTLVASDEAALREMPLPPPEALPPNPVAEPDLASADMHDLVFEGGAMGGMTGAEMDGQMLDMRALAEAGRFWAINGTVPTDLYGAAPLLRLTRGRTHVLRLENRTAWFHPIHLHGHSFRVLEQGGDPVADPPMRDTVLLAPREEARIAFVADNPGRWMLHCHVLSHQASGMMGVVEVV